MESSSEKVFFRSVKILQNYGHESVAHFLAHPAFPLLCNTFESLFLILDRVIVFFSFFTAHRRT